MPFGFAIDQNRCIGCHACTVACKSENDVPLGDFRTWVKYTEIGSFPTVKRHFAVLRCNHCTDAPCVTVCPVTALHKRDDGIVDLDRDVCIGCKSCMQACPYDALTLNEHTGGAEKCHFCAHRVDQGLQPACVVVCPEEAIIAGDYSDPNSEIAKYRAREDAVVRRPEKGTKPNVHYVGIDPVSLQPGTAKEPDTYLWSERRIAPPDYPDGVDLYPEARTVLDVNHKVHWGTPVSLYLLTKGISAGVILLAPLFGMWNANSNSPELIGLLFLVITLCLLVLDLKRPSKFLSIMLRPNFSSWLVKGAYVLGAFGAAAAATVVCRVLGEIQLADACRYLGIPLAIAAAGYTAFLFGQCKGRDLWLNTPVLFLHLACQAVMLGAVTLLPAIPDNESLAWLALLGGTGHLLFALLEAKRPHDSTNAKLAASLLPRIPAYADAKIGAFGLGLALTTIATVALPLLVIAGMLGGFTASALMVTVWFGTFFYEQAFLRAGQLPPLS